MRLVDDGLLGRVDAVDDADDEHEQAPDDGGEERAEDDPGGHAPAEMRMVRAQHALDEDQVGDEDDDDAGVGEDLGGDGDAGVYRVAGPDDAHDVCGDAGHGEAEEEAGEDELVAAAPVALEDCHVEDGGADEEGEDDGGDGDVDGAGWGAAEAGVFGGVGGALVVKISIDVSCHDDDDVGVVVFLVLDIHASAWRRRLDCWMPCFFFWWFSESTGILRDVPLDFIYSFC